MAVDTAEKRFSMMGVGIPFITHVIPQGSVGKSSRCTLLSLYGGLSNIVNLKHSWDYITQSASTFKMKTAISTLKFKVNK